MKKLNIMEDMAEDINHWRLLISRPTPGVGKIGTLNGDVTTTMMMMMVTMMIMKNTCFK